ncbi:hypothetical protein DH86_00000682 [Scytalidium sp. 3C]|nr:hypothetical protein DH86_00000682 [Scytalidium sp. 3C]
MVSSTNMSPPSAMTQEAESTGTVPVTAHSKTAQAAQPYETASNGVTPKPPVFEDKYKEREYQKGRLALAFRIFAKLGFDEGIAGHITLRDPVEPTSFWVNPFGVAWPTLKASDLIRVDKDGKVVDGGPVRLLNVAAYMIHHAVHTARPDVNCVAHSHSIYGRAFCALGRPLDIITQDACTFYNDIALYKSFRGIVLGPEEGIEIAAALGNKKAALLQNHGLLTCGKTIESCVRWFCALETCCQAQLLADAAAGGRGHETVKIDDADAEFTWRAIGHEDAGWFGSKPAFELMARESGDEYLM